MRTQKLLGTLFLGSLVAHATSAQEIQGRPDIWFFINSQYDINEKWSLGNELHFRFDNYLRNKEQLLIRPSLHFKPKNTTYSVGYSFIETFPFGNFPLPDNRPEHNLWEQVTLHQSLGKLSIKQRYRSEQRWQGNFSQSGTDNFDIRGFDFSNRFRYRLTLIKPITKKWSINIFNEVWIKGNRSFRRIGFDRNWFYAGTGFKISSLLSIQGAYLHQYIMNNPDRFERHHTFQLTSSIKIN